MKRKMVDVCAGGVVCVVRGNVVLCDVCGVVEGKGGVWVVVKGRKKRWWKRWDEVKVCVEFGGVMRWCCV